MQSKDKPAPDADAWKIVQEGLNRVGLADPLLEVDGDPGSKTLEAAQGLVPLIQKTQREEQGLTPKPRPTPY